MLFLSKLLKPGKFQNRSTFCLFLLMILLPGATVVLPAQEQLFPLGFYQSVDQLFLSQNGEHYALQYSPSRNQTAIVIDGEKFGEYDTYFNAKIDVENGTFSLKSHTAKFAVMNGTVFNSPGKIFGSASSSSGEETAYAEQNGDQWYLYQNYKRSLGPYEFIYDPQFSPLTNKLVLRFIENGKAWIKIGDEKLGPFDIDTRYPDSAGFSLGKVFFSDDESMVAYSVIKGDQWHVIINGETVVKFSINNYMGTYRYPQVFFNENNLFAVVYESEYLQQSVYFNGETIGPFRTVIFARFSKGNFLFTAKPAGSKENILFVNGREYRATGTGYRADVSQNKRKIICSRGVKQSDRTTKYFIDDNGKEYGSYDRVRKILIHNNGKSWLAIVKKGREEVLIINGKEVLSAQNIDGVFDFKKKEVKVLFVKDSAVWRQNLSF